MSLFHIWDYIFKNQNCDVISTVHSLHIACFREEWFGYGYFTRFEWNGILICKLSKKRMFSNGIIFYDNFQVPLPLCVSWHSCRHVAYPRRHQASAPRAKLTQTLEQETPGVCKALLASNWTSGHRLSLSLLVGESHHCQHIQS